MDNEERLALVEQFSVTGKWCIQHYIKEISIILETIKALNRDLSCFKGVVKISTNLYDIRQFLEIELDKIKKEDE